LVSRWRLALFIDFFFSFIYLWRQYNCLLGFGCRFGYCTFHARVPAVAPVWRTWNDENNCTANCAKKNQILLEKNFPGSYQKIKLQIVK
jgi:hypothetical protein